MPSGIPTGPKDPKSTVLSIEEEAIVVAFRRDRLLPLDDCPYALQPTTPHLSRSSVHRCLQRRGISGLPQVDGDKPDKRRFTGYRRLEGITAAKAFNRLYTSFAGL